MPTRLHPCFLGLLALPILVACAPICDGPIHDVSTVEELESACTLPNALEESWSCSEPIPHRPTLVQLEHIHRRCKLESLGSTRAFARSGGQPVKAALVFGWLRDHKVPGASRAAKLYLKAPPIPLHVQLPVAQGIATKPIDEHQVIMEPLEPDGTWGRFGYWHLAPEQPGQRRVALPATMPLQTLRHLVASHATATEPLELLVESDHLTSLAIYPPTSMEASMVSMHAPTHSPLPPDTAVRLTGSSTLTVAHAVRAAAYYSPRRVELALDHAPCLEPTDSMRCFEGKASQPTFYIDTTPTQDDGSCARAGYCRGTRGQFQYAAQLCTHQGKRLPTHFEAEAAGLNSGRGSWTQTVDAPGPPPLGACGGLYPCAKRHQRKLTDGSSRHVNDVLESPVYCASDFPVSTTYPPFMVRNPLAVVPEPKPSPREAALATKTIRHDNLEDKGICGEDIRKDWKLHQQGGGRATTSCRDPYSYVTTNEQRRFVWAPYIRNLGGGYAGVGAAQNYDMIAEARSQWAWIFDYDPNVYRLHQILKPLILASENPDTFVALFGTNVAQQERAVSLIESSHGSTDSPELTRFYYGYRKRLWKHYTKELGFKARRGAFSWLANPERYAYIRTLHQQDRIIPVKGDMLGQNGLRSIGTTAKALNIPIRIYYTSNAPTAWGGQVTDHYKANVLSFPFDPQSVLLATYSAPQYGQRGYWLYTVGHGQTLQNRIAQAESNRFLVWDRIPSPDPDLALCQVPSVLPGL